ncbi:FAD-binding protein [Kutzneria kofuensis]|uniref:Xylitol oxidase n=1 Tax=Kutzneria kofuensis TaxID=103725 RepID=A0A7W9KQP3_9PSEU|nr:FAD-binding protein [Kutzneria kofuensis]MBB5896983.1 xylitol oxidase [Kutzneria kofuensis]
MEAVNWAGNLVYKADRILRPRTVDEVREMVAAAPRIKTLGTRHCFNDIADFDGGVQIDIGGVEAPIEFDTAAATVTVSGATRYGELAPVLHARGFALPNLASLPHCTIAGSVATGTHGSGRRNQGLASAVSALDLVTADGELHSFAKGDKDFPGVVVNVGALGVVTRMTLDLVPAFEVRQNVFDALPWDALFEHVDEIEDAAYSVSLFTNWANDAVDLAWLKTVGESRTELFGATPADGPRHPAHAAGLPADNCTEQLGVPGPWHERLPHFKLGFTPSVGDELQSEYFVPYRHAAAAFEALRGLGDRIAPLVMCSEIRAIAADDLWLSPAQGGDRIALHFTWYQRRSEVEALLPLIEERLAPFGVRAHWGKVFHHRPTDEAWPMLADFRDLRARLDPDGVFENPYVARNIG